MSEEPVNPHHERHYEELARILNDAAIVQARHQDAVGFGAEGDRLRHKVAIREDNVRRIKLQVAPAELVEELELSLQHARDGLRNYYIAKLALINTEVAEAIEEIRNGHEFDEVYFPTSAANEPGFEMDGHVKLHKPEGAPTEIGDALIRVLSLAGEAGIPIGDVVVQKLRYNETRAQKHGGKVI